MDFAADLPILYADHGRYATYQAKAGGPVSTGYVLLDQPGVAVINGDLLATDLSLRFAAASFPNVRKGDTFAFDGATYTARESAQPLLDGLEMTVPVARS